MALFHAVHRYWLSAVCVVLLAVVCVACTGTQDRAKVGVPAPPVEKIARAKVRVLLIGDSTVRGSVPRTLAPQQDHLEDMIRKRLAAEGGLPFVEVINKGEDNDTIQRMLGGRYERDVAKLPGGPVDFVFIRFGINDRSYLADWSKQFPETYRELIARIRRDQPSAMITLETIIPYRDALSTLEVNNAILAIAAEQKLPVLDTHARYAEALASQGQNALNYRHAALRDVPEQLRPLVPTRNIVGESVFVLDDSLDAQLGGVKNWYSDRHPNLAGYRVIAGVLADYLAPLIRERFVPPPDAAK